MTAFDPDFLTKLRELIIWRRDVNPILDPNSLQNAHEGTFIAAEDPSQLRWG